MTYAQLNLVFLLVATLAATVLSRRAGVGSRWWQGVAVVVAVLAVLTVVFDSLMIMADLFRYDDDLMIGLDLWLTPVEDLAWPVAAGLVLPALWTWLGRADRRGRAGGPARADRGQGEDLPGREVEL